MSLALSHKTEVLGLIWVLLATLYLFLHCMHHWDLINLPKVGEVCRRGEYKLGIYSDRSQCPASRGKGTCKTVFLDFVHQDVIFSSQ